MKARVLRFIKGNVLDLCGLSMPDIVIMEIDVPAVSYPKLCSLLNVMRPGSRLVTYLHLPDIWTPPEMPFAQLPFNASKHDRCVACPAGAVCLLLCIEIVE